MPQKLGQERSQLVNLRIPGEWWKAFGAVAEIEQKPIRELLREALKQYLLGKERIRPDEGPAQVYSYDEELGRRIRAEESVSAGVESILKKMAEPGNSSA